MNNRFPEGGLYCKLGKAFDCVNHEIGVDALQSYGIKGKFLGVIQSYLTARYQSYLFINLMLIMEFILGGEKLQLESHRFRFWAHCFSYLYMTPVARDSDTKVVHFAVNTSIVITIPNKRDLKQH
jgi:hypothetical protein